MIDRTRHREDLRIYTWIAWRRRQPRRSTARLQYGSAPISCRSRSSESPVEQFGERLPPPRVHPPRAGRVAATSRLSPPPGPAARFAAKEATIKVLRPDDVRIDWRSIEVHREDSGACGLRLSDSAAELADAAGISSLAVSLTHENRVRRRRRRGDVLGRSLGKKDV